MTKYYNVSYFDSDTVDLINEIAAKEDVNLTFANTVGISSDDIRKLYPNVQIRVIGGLDKLKYNNPKYIERTTYSPVELTNILKRFEYIESKINKSWDQKKKALFIYEQLSMFIEPAIDYENYDFNVTQSLKCIAAEKGICAGMSLVFKELMDRQSIDCDYVRGSTPISRDVKHAWNVLHIDDEIIPVDVTWSSSYFNRNHKINYSNFGLNKDFIEKHIPDKDERVLNYEEKKEFNKTIVNTNNRHSTKLIQRRDGSCFYLSKIDIVNNNGKNLYKYMQTEYENGNLGKMNILYSEMDHDRLDPRERLLVDNNLFSKDRIKRYGSANGAYMGYIDKNGDKVIDRNMYDVQGKITNIERIDETNISLEMMRNDRLENNGIYTYKSYEFLIEHGFVCAKEDTIYTETNINRCMHKDLINFASQILSRNRLDKKTSVNAGYVGSLTKNMEKTMLVNNGEYTDNKLYRTL